MGVLQEDYTHTRVKGIGRASSNCPVMIAALKARGCVGDVEPKMCKANLDRLEVLEAGLNHLEDSTQMLSPAFRKKFDRQSPWHSDAAFRPGFLVPHPEAAGPEKLRKGCAVCGKHDADCDGKKLKACPRCKSIYYCSKACQEQHWPTHKRVCKADVSKLREQSDEGRPSLVVPMKSYISFMNEAVAREKGEPTSSSPLTTFNMSLNGAPGGDSRGTSKSAERMRNVHGEAEFTVKVQVPMTGDLGTCMVYDEVRSFQCAFSTKETPEGPQLHRLIRTFGQADGLKGYFAARREGANLRIFYDRLLSPPNW
jgi:hypothetical protein